jgi:deoxyribonuclease IV
MKIGCHVSIAGGIYNAPKRAADLGCETFQVFTRSPQGGKAPELSVDVLKNFEEEKQKYDLHEFVVHTPYYINFGSTAKNIFYGSVSVIKQELERGNMLGARFVMTHLGTYKDIGNEAGEEQVLKGLTQVLEEYKGKTQLLLEIAAGAGSVIGGTLEQLTTFAKELKKYEAFGGICFDTQHAFASGYEINTKEGIKETVKLFDNLLGIEHLRMSHINDSKVECGGKRDRHDHIGDGHIGEEGFVNILEAFKPVEKKNKGDMLLILETEHDKVAIDIEKLKQIRSRAGIK